MASNDNQGSPSHRGDQPTTGTTTTTRVTKKKTALPGFERVSSKNPSQDGNHDPSPRRSSLELSPEEQIKIIQQTGILKALDDHAGIPLEKFSQSNYHLVDTSSSDRKPLIEFTTHELNSFKKITKKKTTTTTHRTQGGVEDSEEEGELKRPKDDLDRQHDDCESPDTLPLWVDRAFDTFLWSVPFNTVFICLDVAIHAQYGQPVSFWSEMNRLKSVVPSSMIILHYTLHYHDRLLSKILLFSLSTIGGSYMVYVMNKLSYLLVMKRVPPLGALWLYSVIRMDLHLALSSLLLVFLWCWIMNLSVYV